MAAGVFRLGSALRVIGFGRNNGAPMPSVSVKFANVPGTEAALGWAGSHAVIADRPEGKAGGMGLGLNGAQLLALAIGGCFCNDLRYISHRQGRRIASIAVEVTLALDGDPLIASSAKLRVRCEMEDGSDASELVEEAKRSSMVGASLPRGIPVTVAAVE